MHISPQMMLPPAEDGVHTAVMAKMPPLGQANVECIGRWFEAYCSRKQHRQTLSYHSLNSSSSEASEDELSDEEEEDEEFLRSLNPKEWKDQDHYKVLGLSKFRYKATEDQIKRAYKKKVLSHHPDKRRARGLPVKEGDDDYFLNVTRAYEVLGIPVKRRSYDSVDPEFDDDIPGSNLDAKEEFFETFACVFESNARFSNKRKVPQLGDKKSTFEEVNNFYSFWYDFDSWREYSYLDEEEKEKGENREERRWIEKQNKAERQKRKKEEVTRIRTLVDNSYGLDPRIARFKEEEKAKKQAQKQAKRDAIQQKLDEEKRIRDEAEAAERQKREKSEEEARVQAAALKKEREQQKNAMKKARKTMRNAVKDQDYFASDEDERVLHMTEVDKLAELLALTSLQELNESLTSGDEEKAKQAFLNKVKEVNDEMEAEKKKHMEEFLQKKSSSSGDSAAAAAAAKSKWPDGELQLLIKGVNLFPAGTVQRWETIANFLHQHMESSNRSPKEVLAKAKELQKMDMAAIKEVTNKKAFERFEQTQQVSAHIAADKHEESQRFDSVAVLQIGETGSNPAPWSAEEQKLLEQSLKTYPASTPERWERIADTLTSRSKKDCMKRYKELVDMVRAKKAAAAAVKKK